MAFSADELRVLRRALAIALQPRTEHAEKQKCLRLAQAVDEAAREGGRLRAFLRADLARYRAALPGTAPGYVERLQDALASGHRPGAEDLAALRALCAVPAGAAETGRRRALLQRCERLTEAAVRARLADCAPLAPPSSPAVPAARPGLRDHDGVLRPVAGPEAPKPGAKPPAKPGAAPDRPKTPPAAPAPKGPRPDRPIPTPGEVFPPRRKPAPPAGGRAPEGHVRGDTEVRHGPPMARA